ncbi:MAG: histidine kinase [Arcobacter sp.]|nr:histidine kinase [Arcobacter sp.]|tara:strand:+ start:23894 stop:25036 length:1143 start_codon:yes stop_codon:yes gene_type:complete
MKKSEQWFKHIFNNTGVGILVVDKKRTILEANKTVCDMLGYKYEEVINKHAEIFHISEESSQRFQEITFNTIFKSNTLDLEYKFKHKDGHPVWIKITGDVIKDKDEVLWIVTDIDKRVKFQEELASLNDILNNKLDRQIEALREKDRQLQYQARLAQMGEMLNMISHQWRQPLMSICATTSFLHGKLLINEFEQKQFIEELEIIEDSSEFLSNTINDFRNFFKIDKEKINTSFESIVDTTLKIIKPILSNNHIEIKTKYESYKTIFSLENEIRQVVLNILKNSEDAFIQKNIKDRKILISTFTKDNFTFLEISDNAGGIKPSLLNKIFDSYFTTKDSINGTGLGLCMSKTIIEDNCKGTITAKNNNKNGVDFTIKLPIKK